MNPKPQIDRSSKKLYPTHVKNALALIIKTCESNLSNEVLNTPLGLARNGDVNALFDWADTVGTDVFPTAAQHFAANQLAALVLKYPWPSGSLNRVPPRQAAVEKFADAEERCRRTNRRLRNSRSRFDRYLVEAALWIERVIGCEPDLPEIYSMCDFSSGANIGVHGNATNLYRKLNADWSVSPTAEPYLISALQQNFHYFEHLCEKHGSYRCYDRDQFVGKVKSKVRYTHYNKLSFVPKNAKTHRAIAIEPVGNSIVQKGIDQVLRSRLNNFGINLSNQERNAYLAKKGSIDGSLATIDLSSASDTVSIAITKRLLPPAWFALLDATRSPAYKDGKEAIRYQKFVSMGNGFCFPLETLIFAALIKAVQQIHGFDKTFGVYGDDLIVDAKSFTILRQVLLYSGFKLNSEKSFSEGPFRESCGTDWYEGQDVRPAILDDPLSGVSSIMIFHNSTLRSERCRTFFTEVRPWLRSLVRNPFLRPEEFRVVRDVDPLKGLDVVTVRKSHGTDVRIRAELFSKKLDKTLLANANGAFSVPYDVFMSSSCAKWDRNHQRWVWKEFRFIPEQDTPSSKEADEFQMVRSLAKIRSIGSELNLRYTTRRVVVLT